MKSKSHKHTFVADPPRREYSYQNKERSLMDTMKEKVKAVTGTKAAKPIAPEPVVIQEVKECPCCKANCKCCEHKSGIVGNRCLCRCHA